MKADLEKTLETVAEETFAAMAFVFPISEEERIAVPTAVTTTSAVTFSGPLSGGLVLTVPSNMPPSLAANILGLPDDQTPTPEQGRDALLEVLNVICGNLLPKITTPKEVFHVDEPHLMLPGEAEEIFADSKLRADVRLPLECGAVDLSLFVDEMAGKAIASEPVRMPRIRPMQILVADDDAVLRHVLDQTLRRFGYDPVIALDGQQAWDILQQPNAPRLLIFDWLMPGIPGIDLCRMVRMRNNEIEPFILLLTGISGKRELAKGFEAGADDCITKSFQTNELLAKVRLGERVIRLEIELRAVKKALKHEILQRIGEADGLSVIPAQ